MTPRDIIAILAAVLVVIGVALIYPPAALVAAGIALGIVFLTDFEPRRRV